MTNEEAKERIQSLYNDWLPIEYNFEVFDTEENKLDREAFVLAIEALKAKSEIENSKSEIKNTKTEISMSKSKITNEEAITILKREFSECKDTISVYAQKRKKAFDMAIKALESQRWIPVSERLPENQDCYLVTTKWKGSYSGDVYIETNMAVYREKPKEWDCVDVIAWMPLPQPYKGESEESNASRNSN